MRFNPHAFQKQTTTMVVPDPEPEPMETAFAPPATETAPDIAPPPVEASWKLNARLSGVEIHFTRRPADYALAKLRGASQAGHRWRFTSHGGGCWYTRQHPETIAFAKSFCENFNGVSVTVVAPVPAPAPPTAPAPAPVARPPRKFIRPPQIEAMPGMSVLGIA